ncbi:MAG: glycosyltransferase family 39 protein [Planctomycetes bacterium]|nr:glycosyltransferase family 39 protein [Planctomycetota bacterium]
MSSPAVPAAPVRARAAAQSPAAPSHAVTPPTTPRHTAAFPRGVALAALGAALLALALVLSHASGAATSDLCSADDEPAHVVTGLMVRDYLASSLGDPLEFAKQFYLHYPKVALGNWPPVFYLVQAAWTLCCGTSALALLALMSLLAATTAGAIAWLTGRRVGWVIGVCTGVWFLLLPAVQASAAAVMAEVPLALLCLLATHRFGRFLDRGLRRDALGFAALATLAILTKGNGLALAMVPPFAIAIRRQWGVLRRGALWAPAALVALLCAPWYSVSLPISASAWDSGSTPSLRYAARAAEFYLEGAVDLGGVVLVSLAALGLVARMRHRPDGVCAAMAAWLAALGVFHLAIPSSIETRHLVLGAPAVLLFAAAGLHALAKQVSAAWIAPTLAPLALLLFLVDRFEVHHKAFRGFADTARQIATDPALAGLPVLVVSDATGEGAFIAGMALAEARPGHIVLRGSKVLATSSWCGEGYTPRFHSDADCAQFLRDLSVGAVVVDLSTRRHVWNVHHRQVWAVCRDRTRFCELPPHDVVRDGVRHPAALRRFVQRGICPGSAPRIAVDAVLGTRVLPASLLSAHSSHPSAESRVPGVPSHHR